MNISVTSGEERDFLSKFSPTQVTQGNIDIFNLKLKIFEKLVIHPFSIILGACSVSSSIKHILHILWSKPFCLGPLAYLITLRSYAL